MSEVTGESNFEQTEVEAVGDLGFTVFDSFRDFYGVFYAIAHQKVYAPHEVEVDGGGNLGKSKLWQLWEDLKFKLGIAGIIAIVAGIALIWFFVAGPGVALLPLIMGGGALAL